jgi:hypothetical protein
MDKCYLLNELRNFLLHGGSPETEQAQFDPQSSRVWAHDTFHLLTACDDPLPDWRDEMGNYGSGGKLVAGSLSWQLLGPMRVVRRQLKKVPPHLRHIFFDDSYIRGTDGRVQSWGYNNSVIELGALPVNIAQNFMWLGSSEKLEWCNRHPIYVLQCGLDSTVWRDPGVGSLAPRQQVEDAPITVNRKQFLRALKPKGPSIGFKLGKWESVITLTHPYLRVETLNAVGERAGREALETGPQPYRVLESVRIDPKDAWSVLNDERHGELINVRLPTYKNDAGDEPTVFGVETALMQAEVPAVRHQQEQTVGELLEQAFGQMG